MKIKCLDFVPNEDQLSLMREAAKGDHEASTDLAYFHNILFIPELNAWFATADQRIEDYRCGKITAEELQKHFPEPAWRG